MTTAPGMTSANGVATAPARSSRNLGLLVLLVVAAGLVAAPYLLKPYGIYILSQWAVMSIAALGLNLTLGYAGQVSLAQAAFVGIGSYTVALMLPAGVPFLAAFVVAGILCFAIGWGLGYPALRVQHHYLAFVTLAFSTLAFLVMRNEQWLTGGIYGLQVQRPVILGWAARRAPEFYYLTLAILAVVTAAVGWMIRSPWGRAFTALRENPVRALSLGVDTRRYTLLAFAIGSGLGGLSGALYAPLVQFIEPNAFSLGLSLSILLMVIVGGAGSFLGPFVGALISVLLPEWLRFAQGYYLMAYAVIVMLLLAFSPTGLVGLAQRGLAALRRAPAGDPVPASAGPLAPEASE